MSRILVVSSLILALTGIWASSALATRAEERQGAALLGDVQAGTQSCSSLSATQFELIGEYLMARMIGNPAAHDAMNARIRRMMGAPAEAQAHVYLAQRNTGCAPGGAPAGYARMMGLATPLMRAAGGGGAMMAGASTGSAAGSMMSGDGHHSGSRWSTAMIVLSVLIGLILLAMLIAAIAVWWRVREYERRRRALNEPPTGAGPAAA